jgi:hypothetical protein
MLPLLGNSSAHCWYDNVLSRLDEYVAHLAACGATATEVVLHHGPPLGRAPRQLRHRKWGVRSTLGLSRALAVEDSPVDREELVHAAVPR